MSHPSPTPTIILTKIELARTLRVSGRKIELSMRDDPNFPVIRWNRSVRFDLAEVVRYLKSQTTLADRRQGNREQSGREETAR